MSLNFASIFFISRFASKKVLVTFASLYNGDVAQLVEHRTENP